MITKEQFTQWYADKVAANLKNENKDTVYLQISVLCTEDMVEKDTAGIKCGWRMAVQVIRLGDSVTYSMLFLVLFNKM